jgi:peptide/nickel transport system substrate-binding protein
MRTMLSFRRLSVIILAFACLLIAGCGQHQRFGNDPAIVYPTDHTKVPIVLPGKYGGSMTGTFLSDPKTFNLWVSNDNDSLSIDGLMFDSLISRDSFTLQFIPRLAYLPKISADGLTYTFTLRPGLKWSDGYPITSDDIIFTLNVIFDPSIETTLREGMLIDVNQSDGTVKREPFKYEKVDESTVKFILPVKWAPAEAMFGINVAPKHLLEGPYKAGQFNSIWGVDTPTSQIAVSGPYKIAKYVPGQRFVFEPNPYFWRYIKGQHLPYLGKFNYLIVTDTNDMVLNFRSGGSDVLAPIPPLQLPTISEYAKRDDYTVVDEGPQWGFIYLGFNLNPTSTMNKRLLKVFQDVRFRQACSYAIDRNALCDDILLGLATPSYAPITQADPQYFDANVRQYPYNPEKARRLLTSMGMSPGPDGHLLYEGKTVEFNILTNTENAIRKDLSTVIVGDLQAIGLDAHFTPINFNELITKLTAPPFDWQAEVLAFGGDPEPNNLSDIWRSSGEENPWWPQQKTPGFPWSAQIDRDFTNGAHELDPAKRKKYYDNFQEILGEEQPVIFLANQYDHSAVRNHFGNIQPTAFNGFGGQIYANLEEIYDTKATGISR